MTAALSVLLELAVLTAVQASPQAARLAELAESASHDELVAETRLRPEEAREAFRDLLDDSPEAPDPAAGRLAAAYSEAWTDPFLLNRYNRFVHWSVDERRLKLTADSLRRAGNEAYLSEGAEEALRLWRLSLVEVEHLADTAGIARSLGNIGAGHYAEGRTDSAAFYYRRSQQLALASGDFVTAANALNVLASLSRESGDLAEAGSLYRRALDMHERVGAVRATGYDHHNLGLLALSLGDLTTARDEFEAAIAISQRTGHADDGADHLSSLADALMAGGDYAGAEEALTRALQLDRETGNRWGEAGVFHSLGLLAMARGDYAAAMEELERAHDLYADLDRVPEAVSVRADLGRARAAAGDLRGGAADLREARRVADTSGLVDPVRADLALAAADLALTLNEYEQARRDYREAERLYQGLGDYGGVAAARHGLAFVYVYQQDFGAAATALQQALATQQAIGDPRATALTRLLLARVHLESGHLVEARSVAADARDVLAAIPDPPGEAAALAALADIDVRAGLHREAEQAYERGLSVLGDRKAPDIAWRLHAGRAGALEGRGRVAEARLALESAVVAIERGVADWTYVGSGSAYLTDKWEVYARLAALQVESGDADGAFETSERLRAQHLLALLDRGRIRPREPGADLISSLQDLRHRIGQLSARLEPVGARDAELRGAGSSPLTREQAETALRTARQEYGRLLDELREAETPYAGLVRPEIATWGAVASVLSDDEVFVEYLLSDSAVLAFVVTTDGVQAVRLTDTRETLRDLVGFTRGVLEDPAHGGRSELWRIPLERLYGILIAPIEAEGFLEGRRHLIFGPHAELHYLSFPALIGADGRFLIERFTVSTTPSAAVWNRLADRPGRVTGGGVLAMAPRSSDLPGTRREAARIREQYGDRADLLLGSEATEDALVATASTYDVIHLATYGVVNRTNPLFSYVELAPGEAHDGRLEAHELPGLDLDADLVVLSACETGLAAGSRADVPAGDDWVGLVRSFLTAGSAQVIASLWRVEDEATANLMGAFHGEFAEGASARDALAVAQRQTLSDPATTSPFYWAGFVLAGSTGRSR